jgi:hypothetical protein
VGPAVQSPFDDGLQRTQLSGQLLGFPARCGFGVLATRAESPYVEVQTIQ